MIRMVNKLLKAKFPSSGKKSFVAGDVKVKHKKVKYW